MLKNEWRNMSSTLTSTRDTASSTDSISSSATDGASNMRESISLRSFSASSAFSTMYASAEPTFTLEFRLKDSFVAPRRRQTTSLSTLTEASLSYWMRVSERNMVVFSTTISSFRK